MTKRIYISHLACLLLIVLFASCHTSKKQTVAYKPSKQPKFIGDIYMNGHNKSNTTANAIKPVASADKAKHYTKTTRTFDADEPVLPGKGIDLTPEPRKLRKKYAEIIGVRQKEIDNLPLYTFIDRWYGTNYRLGGSDQSGIDCSGFAQRLYGEVYGVDLLRTAMDQFKNCKRIKKSGDAEEGDLVFFKQHSKRITHVGVYLANDFFVHASTSQGVIISSLKEEYWHKHYAGIGRIAKGP